MQGHIAIAAMGGCFSQNPDTGAAEATYFPAESVVVDGTIAKQVVREAGSTDFDLGFTQTSFWAKCVVLYSNNASYPTLVMLGTSHYEPGNPRTWCFCGLYPRTPRDTVVHNVDEISTTISDKTNPSDILICTKSAGTNVSVFSAGTKRSERTTTRYETSMRTSQFVYFGMTFREATSLRFYGDMMNNDTYDVHWRRFPMLSMENQSPAIYDADSKLFIEY